MSIAARHALVTKALQRGGMFIARATHKHLKAPEGRQVLLV